MKISLVTTLGAAGLQILNKRCFFGIYFMGNLIDFIQTSDEGPLYLLAYRSFSLSQLLICWIKVPMTSCGLTTVALR